MGMFFNSWKDDDAEYYYGNISETGSSNYNRGYSDGYSAGKKYLSTSEIKKYDKDIDKAYNRGFKAGLELYMKRKEPLTKNALEILLDEHTKQELENNELKLRAEMLKVFLDDANDSYQVEPETVCDSVSSPEDSPEVEVGVCENTL